MNPLRIKIYYEDTDAGGVVYYANYLKYMERARTEFLLDNGIDVAKYHENGFFFMVIHVNVDFKRPARLGDSIEVTTEIIEMTNVTITLRHHISKENTLSVEAYVKVACINKDGKPQRLPEEFRKLETHVHL
ncbi:MAG: tol-pal system-associated acyl-CoA thioesterase [Nitrospirae bacterium]|nr:tol-pal system-associated acyl-CoA thioesterase [Nitrospirota bacterium]